MSWKAIWDHIFDVLASDATVGAVAIVGSITAYFTYLFDVQNRKEKINAELFEIRSEYYIKHINIMKKQFYEFTERVEIAKSYYENVVKGKKIAFPKPMAIEGSSVRTFEKRKLTKTFLDTVELFNYYMNGSVFALNFFYESCANIKLGGSRIKTSRQKDQIQDLEWQIGDLEGYCYAIYDFIRMVEIMFARESRVLIPRISRSQRKIDRQQLDYFQKYFEENLYSKMGKLNKSFSKRIHPSRSQIYKT